MPRDFTQAQKALWLRQNRGVIKEIAEKLSRSRFWVSKVYWGQGTSKAISDAIAEAMAERPLDEERKAA